MKPWLLFLAVAILPIAASSQTQETGARALTVEVFSTHRLTSLTMTPLGGNEWIQSCQGCGKKAVGSALTAAAQPNGFEIFLSSQSHTPGPPLREAGLDGAFRMQAQDGAEIEAAGIWKLKYEQGRLRLLLTLDSERYVAYALNGEAAADEPEESLKAMAVAIRTYALENANRHASEGFNLCDSTHCQALRFGNISPKIEEAVLETAGETLWFHNQRATVFYTQNCGGETEDAHSVWPQLNAPYLKSHSDPYCLRHISSKWHADIPVGQMQAVLRAEGWKLSPRIDEIRVVKRTAAHRAQMVEVSGAGIRVPIAASSFRFAINRSLGWNQIRSDWYTVTLNNGVAHFDGQGYGHGVGLCQAGAFQMAVEGHSYRDILEFYFPSTRVGITPQDHGWQSVQGFEWTLRTVAQQPALLEEGNTAWKKAQSLFPVQVALKPVVFQFPTTELFRQSTNEPGWILAATHGTKIFLQPENVLRKGPEGGTLLHEFLHVLVDSEASSHAPLWLREGLVEALADGSTKQAIGEPAGPLDSVEFDAALVHPANLTQSQRAHANAAELTRELLSQYGLQQVRQWLRSGTVPSEALMRLPQIHQRPEPRSSTPR
jgi:stage II sporulation protein D